MAFTALAEDLDSVHSTYIVAHKPSVALDSEDLMPSYNLGLVATCVLNKHNMKKECKITSLMLVFSPGMMVLTLNLSTWQADGWIFELVNYMLNLLKACVQSSAPQNNKKVTSS